MKSKKAKLIAVSLVVIVVLAGVTAFASKLLASRSNNSSVLSSTDSGGSKFKASADINKTFEFDAINQKKQTKKIKFTLASVERKDEIKVKGETRTAPKNYDFLLVRIEMENTQPERLALTPSDFIRLQDKEGKLFAPDYHNGNVILDPISVKKDLMSFIVKKDAKSFVLQIGELTADKEKVEVAF